MSRRTSPSTHRPYGIARVLRVWDLPRSTFYDGPMAQVDDAEIVARMRETFPTLELQVMETDLQDVLEQALASGEVELIADFALPFAVRVQCAFLGWPPTLHEPLVHWTQKNYAATLAQDHRLRQIKA